MPATRFATTDPDPIPPAPIAAEVPALATRRLVLTPFRPGDASALAAILRAPEVAKGILANGSTPARARAAATRRIAWHNATWESHGYGIWALRRAAFAPNDAKRPDTQPSGTQPPEDSATPLRRGRGRGRRLLPGPGALIGWCGFTQPELGQDPELLYGLDPSCWHQGLAAEAAEAALRWLFTATPHRAAAAAIFGRVNPGSTRLIERLGFERQGRLAIADFLHDRVLARDIIAYETWRLGRSKSATPERLLFEAPFKAGQIASLFAAERTRIADALRTAASARKDLRHLDHAERLLLVRDAFEAGLAEPWLDWWRKGK